MEIGRKITEQSKLRYVPIPIVSRTFYFSRLVPSLSALSTCKNLCSFFFSGDAVVGFLWWRIAECPLLQTKQNKKKAHEIRCTFLPCVSGRLYSRASYYVFVPAGSVTSEMPCFFWLSPPLFCLSGALVEIRRRRLPQATANQTLQSVRSKTA
jgi:hypothetical protein